MSTKTREVIWGGRIMGAKMRAETARKEVARAADRAEAEAWSIRMEGYGGPAQPSPDDTSMPERRIRLARNRMLPVQDES
jgi:hypothetical protein